MKKKLVVVGAAGRMGKRIISLASEDKDFDIIGAVERKGHFDIGKDAGITAGIEPINLKVDEDFPDSAEVVVDFCGPYAGSLEVVYRGDTWQGASWLTYQTWRGGVSLSGEDHAIVEDMMPALDYLREEKVPMEGEEEYSPPIIIS